MALKYFYYVLVLSDGQAKFVTNVDNATKTAYWDSNKKPMAFTKTYADDLALCLSINFYPAFTLKSYHELKGQIFIPKEPANEEK
jgi:hypothetical protein